MKGTQKSPLFDVCFKQILTYILKKRHLPSKTSFTLCTENLQNLDIFYNCPRICDWPNCFAAKPSNKRITKNTRAIPFNSIPFLCPRNGKWEKKQKTLQLYCVPRAIVLPHNKRIVLGSRDYEFYFRLVFGLFCVNFWMAMDKRNFLPDLRKSCWIPMI